MGRATVFLLTAGAVALGVAGCSCGETCATSDQLVAERCGARETGGWMCERFQAASCNRCVESHFAGGGDCATLGAACVDLCCLSGPACTVPPFRPPPRFPEAGFPEAGFPPDADAGDAGRSACGSPGQVGGPCLSAELCAAAALTCVEDPAPDLGDPRTLGTFGIEWGVDDPANPGEYRGTGIGADVPVLFVPVGQCTRGCDPTAAVDRCWSCATCTSALGGSPAWDEATIDARFADVSGATSAAEPGICRLDCQYDPDSDGACPPGQTCDPARSVCLERCVSDVQCNLAWGYGRHEGLLAHELEGRPYVCDFATGRCAWSPPPEAAVNTECAIDADCPHPGGICLRGGRCATLACADATGTGPIPCDGACVGYVGSFGSICVPPCDVPDDCAPGQACSRLSAPLPTGEPGICLAVCVDDAECRATERCHPIAEDDPSTAGDDSLAVCDAICDPDPEDAMVVPDAVACPAGERCLPADDGDHGFCEPVDRLCFEPADCHGTQSCEVLSDDLFGRCVDGCETDADCPASEQCRRPDDGAGRLPYGVCRAPDAACAPSPRDAAGAPIQPLRGDAQCPYFRTCSSTDPEVVGRCTDGTTDGGVPDAGVDAGG